MQRSDGISVGKWIVLSGIRIRGSLIRLGRQHHAQHVQLNLKVLPVLVSIGMQDQSAAEHLNGGKGEKARNEECREAGNKASQPEFTQNRDEEDHGQKQQDACDEAEERKWAIVTDQTRNGAKYFESV